MDEVLARELARSLQLPPSLMVMNHELVLTGDSPWKMRMGMSASISLDQVREVGDQ